MKKRFAIFALMLMAAVGMQAQSLIGTWKTTMNDDDGGQVEMYVIFNQRTFTIKGVFAESDPEVGSVTGSVTLPGTYTRSGNTLNLKIDPEQADLRLDKIEFTDEVNKTLEEMPEMKKTITGILEQSINEGKADIVKSLSLEGELTIESLTATQLILDDHDEKVTFTRVR